ncbi:MAG: ComEA family DNA-binding protein [Oscillospiraceae bacterium]|nr:ComEA family DNA-binding protein [Oscillospiraceae bacterium]
MKISKWEFSIVTLCVAFLAFTAGWFLRMAAPAEPVRVEVQGNLPGQTVTIDLTGEESPPATSRPGPEGRVNINTAGVEELTTLPGIGEKRAQDIIAEREENGPFRFPEDITRVKGIGEETLAGLLDYITTEEEP